MVPALKVLNFVTGHPLNQGQKARALLGFARWQIASRLLRQDVVCDWVNGTRFLARTGEKGITGNIYAGLAEFNDMAYVLHVIDKDELFVDVGANVGAYTILACGAMGARGYAFEPIPDTHARLEQNIRLNRLEGRVKSPNVAIGAWPGIVGFTSGLETVNHALAEGEVSQNTVQVAVVTLDTALGDDIPAVIKIDVEGFETPVLAGADRILRAEALHSIIMELNGSGARYNYSEAKILELMFDHGFRSYTYDPFTRALTSLNGSGLPSGNTLFVRDLPRVEAKLRGARPVHLLRREF